MMVSHFVGHYMFVCIFVNSLINLFMFSLGLETVIVRSYIYSNDIAHAPGLTRDQVIRIMECAHLFYPASSRPARTACLLQHVITAVECPSRQR